MSNCSARKGENRRRLVDWTVDDNRIEAAMEESQKETPRMHQLGDSKRSRDMINDKGLLRLLFFQR